MSVRLTLPTNDQYSLRSDLPYDNLTPIYNTLPTNDHYSLRSDLPYDNLTPIYNTLPTNDQYSPRLSYGKSDRGLYWSFVGNVL
jgi:hypothetical protein